MKRKRNRRSYKNAIAIAVASFTSVALISTGLAAFVLVRESNVDAAGKIMVAEVVDNDITLALTSGADGSISLDAAQNDNDGRIKWDGTNYERLSHTVAGTIALSADGNRTLSQVALSYIVNVKKVDGGSVGNADFLVDFMGDNKRLDFDGAPTAFATDMTVTPSGEGTAKTGTFTFDFKFKWGLKYSGLNPSIHYDSKDDGEYIYTIDEAKTELELLKTLAAKYVFEIVVKASFSA